MQSVLSGDKSFVTSKNCSANGYFILVPQHFFKQINRHYFFLYIYIKVVILLKKYLCQFHIYMPVINFIFQYQYLVFQGFLDHSF